MEYSWTLVENTGDVVTNANSEQEANSQSPSHHPRRLQGKVVHTTPLQG